MRPTTPPAQFSLARMVPVFSLPRRMQRLLKAREMVVEPVRSLSGSKSNSMAIAPAMPPTFTSP